MRRLAFLIALPLIGLAGFVLSFYSPSAAHSDAQQQHAESSASRSNDKSLEHRRVAKGEARNGRGAPRR